MIKLLWAKTRQTALLVRLKPFDTSTSEGRSKERYRRAALTTVTSVAARGISLLTVLISVPLTVGYLGTERYGVWMTISSIIGMLSFTDLGIGYGLMNAVSEAHGKDDRDAARRYVSSAFFMLLGVAVLIGIIFGIVYPFISWQRLFNVISELAIQEAGPALAVFVACFALNMPLGIVQRVQMGYQEGFTNDLWIGLGSLLGLGGVLLCIHLKAGLPWLVLAMAGGPVLALALNGVVLFRVKRPWLCPQWCNVTGESAKRILRIGILFFILQIAGVVAYTSDNMIAAQIWGPEAVTQYSVPMTLFSVIFVILGIIVSPLWPAYSESIARGDIAWVKRTLVGSIVISLVIAGPIAFLFVIFGVQIVHLWVGPEITPSFLLLLGFGAWTIIAAVGNAVAMFLNGANVIQFQVVVALLMAVSALVLKILLAHTIALPGIIWGTIIAYSVFTAIPMAIFVPKLLSTLQSRTTVRGVASVS